jgi:DNA-binding transcriptional MerR regulator
MNYATRHAADLFTVSPETIRNWANEFAEHFSVVGNPPKGKQRRFTLEDLEIFSLIAQMKEQGATFDEIRAALANGQRGALPPLPIAEMDTTLAPEKEKHLAVQMQYLQQQLIKVETERNMAQAQLQPLKDEIIRIQAQLDTSNGMYETRIEELNEQVKDAQKRIEGLIRETAEAYYRGLLESRPKNQSAGDT